MRYNLPNHTNIKSLLSSWYFPNKHILKLIIKHLTWFSDIEIYTKREEKIPQNKLEKIIEIYKKYDKKKIPIEYLLWYVFFMWEKFLVNKHTLIPRPETEYLVRYCVNNCNILPQKINNVTLFDIWTWSGIIAIMLAKYTNLPIIASDISEKALKLARQNAENILWKNHKIQFIKSNLWEHLKNYNWNLIICANLPYVSTTYNLDKYTQKEPSIALFAWEDWLALYRKLINQIKQIQNNTINCFFELTQDQAQTLKKEFKIKSKILPTCHKNIKIMFLEFLQV